MGTARDITTSAMLVPCQLPRDGRREGASRPRSVGRGRGRLGQAPRCIEGVELGQEPEKAGDLVCNWRGVLIVGAQNPSLYLQV